MEGRSALAALLAEGDHGKIVSRIGFGVNDTPPAPEDKALTDAYIKQIGEASYPAPGQVRFAWSLDGPEANGKAIKEFGLILADGTLFSRKTRGVIQKESDISLLGTWTISF
jgi:hypothetical protein